MDFYYIYWWIKIPYSTHEKAPKTFVYFFISLAKTKAVKEGGTSLFLRNLKKKKKKKYPRVSPLHAWTLEYQMLGQGQVKATLEEAFPAKKTHMHTCEPCTYHVPELPNHSTKSTFYKHGVIFSNKLFDCAVNEKSQNDNEEENGERPLIFDGMLWQIPLEELQLKLQSLHCPSLFCQIFFSFRRLYT